MDSGQLHPPQGWCRGKVTKARPNLVPSWDLGGAYSNMLGIHTYFLLLSVRLQMGAENICHWCMPGMMSPQGVGPLWARAAAL